MASRILPLVALVAAVWHPAAARAATFTPISQQRFVSLADIPRAASQRIDAVAFDPFEASLGSGLVSQTSSFAATQILAATPHTAATGSPGPTGEPLRHFVVESFFSAVFEVDAATEYLFQARIEELEAVTDIAEFFPWWDLQIVLEASLVGPGGSLAAFSFDLHADCAFQQFCSFSQPLVASGTLAPGLYTLSARSFAELDTDVICIGFGCSNGFTTGSSSTGRVSVDLQAIPEPASLPALALGLALLAWRARRSLPTTEAARAFRSRARSG